MDIQDKISGILSDPEAMEQIKSLGAMLGLDGSSDTPQVNQSLPTNQQQTQQPQPQQQSRSMQMPQIPTIQTSQAQPNLQNGLAGLLSNPQAMSMITKLMPLFQGLNSEDETTRLLDALAPFLSGERTRRLETAKQLLRIFRLLPLLRDGF